MKNRGKTTRSSMFRMITFLALSSFLYAGCSGSSDSGSSTSSSTTTTTTTTTTAVDAAGGTGFTNSTSGTGSALKVAEQVSVVDAQTGSSGKPRLGKGKALSINFDNVRAASALPAGSEYNTDNVSVWVSERSSEAFDQVNEILCMIGQTKYVDMVNTGAYIAQIDKGKCSSDKDSASNASSEAQSSSSGGSEGSQINYAFWTVISSRVDSSSPHIVRAWIHEKEDGRPDQEIQARVIITEAATDANPYGLFTVYFKSEMPAGTVVMKGYLRTVEQNNKIVLQFVDQGGFDFNHDGVNDDSFSEASSLEKNADGTSGGGSISKSGSHKNGSGGTDSEEKEFNMAFNENYFYRAVPDDLSTAVCLDRSDPIVNSWRYNLYKTENDATDPGGRVTRTSGFPIEYNNGQGHGYVSYWGLWANDGTLSTGDTVTKQVRGGTGTEYTVFISQGKLTKHTRQSVILGDLKGVPIEFGMDDGSGNWKQFQVTWNGTNLIKTATLNQTNWQWAEIPEAEQTVVDFSSSWMKSLDFWSRSLGGSGRIELRESNGYGGDQLVTLSNSTPVVFHLQNLVYPSDTIPASFACFNDCLDPSNLSAERPYIAGTSMGGGSFNWNTSLEAVNMNTAPSVLVPDTNYYVYTFDTTNYALKRGGVSLIMPETSQSTFGMRSGALVDPAILDDDSDNDGKADMACDWNVNATCAWNIWGLSEYYTWESGLEDWNHFSALKDSNGAFLKFEPPLSVAYTHDWGNGTDLKFFLEYGGTGDLWGIPGKCVNMETGADVSCWEEGQTIFPKWVPQFSIADGSIVSAKDPATGDSVSYYVKALEKEEVMRSVATTNCSATLTLTSYDLPAITDWIDPEIGTEPTVEDAPAVVGGVVQ